MKRIKIMTRHVAVAAVLAMPFTANAATTTYVDWGFECKYCGYGAPSTTHIGIIGTIDFDITSLDVPQTGMTDVGHDLQWTYNGVAKGTLGESHGITYYDTAFAYDGISTVSIEIPLGSPSNYIMSFQGAAYENAWQNDCTDTCNFEHAYGWMFFGIKLDATAVVYLQSNIRHYLDVYGNSLEPVNTAFSVVNTVPVPAAVWLFGSGLLGLIGLARRNA